MVLWTKLWYYGQNYGTIPRTMELRFTKEKNMLDYQQQEILFLMEKSNVICKIIEIFKQIYSFRTLIAM